MNSITLVPELNYWLIRILKSSPVADTYCNTPTTISDFWRDPNSVLELLFNECFNPDLSESSSSSSGTIYRPYITSYRSCNLNLIPDKNVMNRIQLYRWFCTVYACDSEKFTNMFDTTGTHYPPTQPENNVIYDSGLDYLEASADTPPTLPYDVAEADRSPYISYTAEHYLQSNYTLVKSGAQTIYPYPPTPPPISIQDNVFNFTDQDLILLDMLFDYKVFGVYDLAGINYVDLISNISRLIYCYLQAFCYKNFEKFDSEDPICINPTILPVLYEKHILDLIYQLKSRQYGVIYKNTSIVNDTLVEENIYRFMIMKTENIRTTITQEIIDSNEIVITQNIPWDKKDFSVFKDGIILEADAEYTMVLDFSDPTNVVARVQFLTVVLELGEIVEMIWSYVSPYSPISQPDE
jgi:hypothetical protein